MMILILYYVKPIVQSISVTCIESLNVVLTMVFVRSLDNLWCEYGVHTRLSDDTEGIIICLWNEGMSTRDDTIGPS